MSRTLVAAAGRLKKRNCSGGSPLREAAKASHCPLLTLFRLLPDRPHDRVTAGRWNLSRHSPPLLVYSRCAFQRDPTLTDVALP
jgi:hypothetical protein